MDLFLLGEFRELDPDITNEKLAIPESYERRSATNKKWLLGFLVTLVILIPFMSYTLAYSDIRRWGYGLDPCGNLCGHTNPKIDGIPCSGVDYSNETYVIYELNTEDSGRCVSKCPANYTQFLFFLYCDKNEENPYSTVNHSEDASIRYDHISSEPEPLGNIVSKSCWKMVLSCIITIGIAILGLSLFRFATAALVWGTFIGGAIVSVALAIFFWVIYANIKHESHFPSFVDPDIILLSAAIFMTIAAFVIIFVSSVLFRKINLVILLYKETTKAVFAMPKMMIIPVLTSIFELIVIVLFAVFNVWALTSGLLTEVNPGVYDYDKNFLMQLSIASVFVVTFWTVQIFIGIQYMIIAGSVSTWYFAKDKSVLNSPILTSVKNTFTFHLGTIVLGSFILLLVAFIKRVVRVVSKIRLFRSLLEDCIQYIDKTIEFLSKKVYIQTALHGQAFFKSGKRVSKLLLANVGNLIAISSIGSYVLGIAQMILIVMATGMSYTLFMDIPYSYVPLAICFVLNVLIVVVCFDFFESAVETLDVCFCEDKVLNDGLSRPYAMSRDLMEFVENSTVGFRQIQSDGP